MWNADPAVTGRPPRADSTVERAVKDARTGPYYPALCHWYLLQFARRDCLSILLSLSVSLFFFLMIVSRLAEVKYTLIVLSWRSLKTFRPTASRGVLVRKSPERRRKTNSTSTRSSKTFPLTPQGGQIHTYSETINPFNLLPISRFPFLGS